MHISILGSSITQFGELWDLSVQDLLKLAVEEALVNAAVESREIEAVFVANKAAGNFENQHHLNALVSGLFSHLPPAMRVEGACASGGLAMLAAEYALLSGQFETVMVVGAEKMTDVSAEETTQILSGAANVFTEQGSTFPALYALLTQMHMTEFGTTREQLSAVAVKNHQHALQNPKAQFHKKFTIEQVSESQLVADPLRVLDCSPISDGASAVILTTKKAAAKPKILGFGHGQDTLDLASRASLTTLSATTKAAQQALSQANLTVNAIQAAEVHDCFTIGEILAIEDLGFFAKGQGGPATLAQETTVGGRVVINPSGGLKACGHPVGATGIKQIAYLSRLIEAGQFHNGLTHNVGGSGATAVVHVLGKGSTGVALPKGAQ